MLRNQALYAFIPESKNAETNRSFTAPWWPSECSFPGHPQQWECRSIPFKKIIWYCVAFSVYNKISLHPGGFVSIPLWEWILLHWIIMCLRGLYFLVSLRVLREVCETWGWPAGGGAGWPHCSKERTISPLAVIKCSATTSAAGSQLTTWAGTSSLKWRLRLLCTKVR